MTLRTAALFFSKTSKVQPWTHSARGVFFLRTGRRLFMVGSTTGVQIRSLSCCHRVLWWVGKTVGTLTGRFVGVPDGI